MSELAPVALVLSTLSIIADVYTVTRTVLSKGAKGTSVKSTLAQTRVAVASVDIFGKFGYILGTSVAHPVACSIGGAMANFADLSIVFWTLCVTFIIVKMIADKSPVISIKKSLRYRFAALSWGIPLILSIIPFMGSMGYAQSSVPWCTIRPDPVAAPVVLFYLPVLLCHFLIIVFFMVSQWSLLKDEANAGKLRRVVRRIKVYPDAFHLVWTACYLQAVQDVVHPFRFIFLNTASQVLLRASMGVISLLTNWRVLHPVPSTVPAGAETYTSAGAAGTTTNAATAALRADPNGVSPAAMKAALAHIHRQRSGLFTITATTALSTVLLCTTVGFALGCLLLCGAATGVAATVKNADIAMTETRTSVTQNVADLSSVQLSSFLAYPQQIHASFHASAAGALLPRSTLEGYLNTSADIRPLEDMLYQLWVADARFLALYVVTPNNQALKIHNAPGGYICTQLRHFTPQWYAEKRTVRTERCRTRQRNFWDSSQYFNASSGRYIPPSYVTTRKLYNPFQKGWYGLGNATPSTDMAWRGGIFDHNLDYPVPIVEAVFHVDWPSVQPTNCPFGWPGGRRTVFKLELQSTELGTALRSVHTGAHGQVVIVDTAGTLMAARNNSAHLFTVNSSHPKGVFFALGDLAREFPSQFAPFAHVTAAHLSQTRDDVVNVPLDSMGAEGAGTHVVVLRLKSIASWRVVLLLQDSDFLQRTQELQGSTIALSNITAAALVVVMWALYFRVTKT